MASASWEKTSTQALRSEVQLLAWAHCTPTGAPGGQDPPPPLGLWGVGRLLGGPWPPRGAPRGPPPHAQHVLAGQAPVVVSSTPWAARRPFAGAAWAAPINGVRRRRR